MWKWSELMTSAKLLHFFCGNAAGEFLPIQLTYTGKTARCHPQYSFPHERNVTHSPSHWSNEDTQVQYIDNIISCRMYIEKVREKVGAEKAALVIVDNFKSQTTKITNHLEENKILTSWLPPNTTERLQPMNVSVNKPAKE